MKTITLQEILTREQLNRVRQIISVPPDFERTRKLREFLIGIQPDLSKHGVLAEYLVYVIEHLQAESFRKWEAAERTNAQHN